MPPARSAPSPRSATSTPGTPRSTSKKATPNTSNPRTASASGKRLLSIQTERPPARVAVFVGTLRQRLLRQNPRQRRDRGRVLRQLFWIDLVERVRVRVVVIEIVQRLGDQAEAGNAGLRQRIDVGARFLGDFEPIRRD